MPSSPYPPYDIIKFVLELTAVTCAAIALLYIAPRHQVPCDCKECSPRSTGAGLWSFPSVLSSLDGPHTPLKSEPIQPTQHRELVEMDTISAPEPESGDRSTDLEPPVEMASSIDEDSIIAEDESPCIPPSPSTSESTAASTSFTTPPPQHRAAFPPVQVSQPRLSSPRIKTSPVISKEEFTNIVEKSPHARKFVHALAMKMPAFLDMENPEEDIESVIFGLTTVASPDLQRETVETYMTKDVAFEHPVCSVKSAPNSREKVLKVYQWYRILSPQLDLRVEHVVFDTKRDVLYVEIVQWFKLFFLPVKPLPARLVTRLELQKVHGLYYISRQDDFYHTTEFARLVIPPIGSLVALLLWLGGVVSYALALAAQVLFGVWQPTTGQVNSPEKEGEGGSFLGDRDELYETPAMTPSTERKEQ